MELSELKRRESELRKRLGDERYEKLYTAQQRIEAMRDRAVYKRQGAGGDTGNMFYANGPDSGIIPNIPSIADYRRGIEALSAKIADMGKKQYEYMLSGDNGKVSALDSAIKNAENQREELRKQMSFALGIGSENKNKDMLRARRTAGEKLFFGAGDSKKAVGLEDEDEVKAPNPITIGNTYITEEEYNRLLYKLQNELELNKQFKEQSYEGTARAYGKQNSKEAEFFDNSYKIAASNVKRIEDEISILNKNREWSRRQDNIRKKVKDEVTDEIFNEPKIIDLTPERKKVILDTIRNSNFLKSHHGKDNVEDINIEFLVTYSFDLSNEDAKEFYDSNKRYEEEVNEIIQDEALSFIPGASEMVAANKIAKGPQYEDRKFNNTLGGEYTTSAFVYTVNADPWPKFDFGKKYYRGYIIYRDDVILKNGDIVEYPFNCVTGIEISKQEYDDFKSAFQNER